MGGFLAGKTAKKMMVKWLLGRRLRRLKTKVKRVLTNAIGGFTKKEAKLDWERGQQKLRLSSRCSPLEQFLVALLDRRASNGRTTRFQQRILHVASHPDWSIDYSKPARSLCFWVGLLHL